MENIKEEIIKIREEMIEKCLFLVDAINAKAEENIDFVVAYIVSEFKRRAKERLDYPAVDCYETIYALKYNISNLSMTNSSAELSLSEQFSSMFSELDEDTLKIVNNDVVNAFSGLYKEFSDLYFLETGPVFQKQRHIFYLTALKNKLQSLGLELKFLKGSEIEEIKDEYIGQNLYITVPMVVPTIEDVKQRKLTMNK